MAKKAAPAATASKAAKASSASTMLDNSPAPAETPAETVKRRIPDVPSVGAEQAIAKPAVSWQNIADRAYFLYREGAPGSQDDHWRQAEQDLRGR